MSKISLFSNASDLRKQQSKLYNSNYTDCSFAFEFLGMDVNASYAVSPEFERVTANVGFAEVDSVGFLNVPANNFSKLFYIKTNDLEFIRDGFSTGLTNTSYGVIGNETSEGYTGAIPFVEYKGVVPFKDYAANFSFGHSKIRGGFANPALEFADNTFLYQDYVRYTAKSITGGYALSDIFVNEQDLLKGVTTMDPLFNTNLTNLLLNASNCENVSTEIRPNMANPAHYPFLLSCKTLVDSLLTDATNPDTTNVSSYLRGQQFLKDLQIQSKRQEDLYYENRRNMSNADELSNVSFVNFSGFGDKKYWVIFHPGDVMAVRLNYLPKNGNGRNASNASGTLGGNPIYNRSYKIYLKMM